MPNTLTSQLSFNERIYFADAPVTADFNTTPMFIVRESLASREPETKEERRARKKKQTQLYLDNLKAQKQQERQTAKLAREEEAYREKQQMVQDRLDRVKRVKETAQRKKERFALHQVVAEQLVVSGNTNTVISSTTATKQFIPVIGTVNSRGETPVKVDHKTVIYIKPGKDVQAQITAYYEREAIKKYDFK
jgi:ATP-dependent 26S proteasome regulatory subunit